MLWPLTLHRPREQQPAIDKEAQVLAELSPEAQNYYKLQSRQQAPGPLNDPHSATTTTTTTERELKEYKVWHPSTEVPYVNCADVQAAFMECMQSGPWKERLTGCDSWSSKVQRCLKMQTDLLIKLRLEDARSVETYKQIASAADSLSVKWLDDYGEDGKMSHAMLIDVYDKRDSIWGVN